MDKNVGNVDIDELKRAREELDRERGVETDPNMYSNYNPNRANEELSQNAASEIVEEASVPSSSAEEEMIAAANGEESSSADAENFLNEFNSMIDSGSTSADVSVVEDDDAISLEVQFTPTEEEIQEPIIEESRISPTEESSSQETETSKPVVDETAGEVDFSVYDNFSDFEVEANKNIIAEEKSALPEVDETSVVEESSEVVETTTDDLNEITSMLSMLSGEETPAASEEDATIEEYETLAVEEEPKTENQEVETADEDDEIESVNMENSISAVNAEEIEDEPAQSEEVDENVHADDEEKPDETEKVSEGDEISKLEAQIAELKAKLKENEEDEQEQIEDDEQTAENYATDAEDDYDAINSLMDSLEGLKPIDLTEEEKREIDAKRREIEERKMDDELQIIDDFKKLERLDRILSEDMEEEQSEVVPATPKIVYPELEPVNFVDIISTEEFKGTDNLSYILGKDEFGKIHYGNLRDFYNMVIYAKDNNSALSAVHSVLVSLILKNATSDINFVICDSKADSKLQVYNKSSYMYFNRLAKTNKEILDTLIEISKELEERYKILAAAGVKSIEQYNVIAKNDNLKSLPYIVTVFNNYTKSMQLADSDKINTILYQILKLGRIVGLYLIVVGNMKIKSDDINYNLPTRLSFEMSDEDDSLSMLGVGGAEALETDDEFLLSSLDSQTPVHLKVPSISLKELEVLIKNIES